MKKSEFIKKVLKNKNNTVFVNKEQVENALALFEKLGMLPPEATIKDPGHFPGDEFEYTSVGWEEE